MLRIVGVARDRLRRERFCGLGVWGSWVLGLRNWFRFRFSGSWLRSFWVYGFMGLGFRGLGVYGVEGFMVWEFLGKGV